MQQGLETERAARERTAGELEAVRSGHGQMEQLVSEMKAIVERAISAAAAAAARPPAPEPLRAGQSTAFGEASRGQALASAELVGDARGAEMADALAAAVERLRARADAA